MEFSLNDELIHDIIFAMENQTEKSLFDSQNCRTCPLSRCGDRPESIDKDRFYQLPEWNSAKGFRIMEQFVSEIHNPVAREDLKTVLFSGKSVFKNFKKVLHSYPDLERKWYFFKESGMKSIIYQWFNDLRESWGLEKLSEEIEDYPDLVQEDFIFREGTADGKVLFEKFKNEFLTEITESDKDGFGAALAQITESSLSYNEEDSFIISAETGTGEVSGIISIVPCPSDAKDTFQINLLYVEKRFRGLGLGRELVERVLAFLRSRGIHRIIIANAALSQQFVPVLEGNGFYQLGSCYVADFFNFS